jgi:transposase-like protein
LGQGSPTRGCHRCGKRFFDETTPTLAQLAAGGLQGWRVQKVFRRFAQAAMGGGRIHIYINKD